MTILPPQGTEIPPRSKISLQRVIILCVPALILGIAFRSFISGGQPRNLLCVGQHLLF